MAFGLFELIFFIAFAFIAITIIAVGGLTFFGVFKTFGRLNKLSDQVLDHAQDAANSGARRTAMDVVGQLPPGTAAHKCKNCGATIDSTAELSADGRVRCNYCNQWTSIYQ